MEPVNRNIYKEWNTPVIMLNEHFEEVLNSEATRRLIAERVPFIRKLEALDDLEGLRLVKVLVISPPYVHVTYECLCPSFFPQDTKKCPNFTVELFDRGVLTDERPVYSDDRSVRVYDRRNKLHIELMMHRSAPPPGQKSEKEILNHLYSSSHRPTYI